MKIAAYIFIGLIVLVCVLFLILGKKSQNGQAFGLVDGRLAPCSSKPNCVSSEEGSPSAASVDGFDITQWSALKDAIKAQGGNITTQSDDYFSAEFSSKLFKFVDDFEARLDGDKIQIRSASRVGYSDRGVNRQRVESLRLVLK
ncbi:MAG: hypothetical protein COA43_08470 [Robiginitomaculum sp.]|nr:MAG: hypothetical protein COA43_08470 [Robiginitomaculum sp.]